jgi:hypothetical protein
MNMLPTNTGKSFQNSNKDFPDELCRRIQQTRSVKKGGIRFLSVEQDTSHGADNFEFVRRYGLSGDNLFPIYSFHLVSPQTKPNCEVLIRLDAHAEITNPNHKTLLPHDRPEMHAPRQIVIDENWKWVGVT